MGTLNISEGLALVHNYLLLMGFKLMAGAVANCAFLGVAVGVGIIYGSLLISIGRNPSQRDELIRYAFIGFSLVEASGLIGLVISLLLLFGFSLCSLCSTSSQSTICTRQIVTSI